MLTVIPGVGWTSHVGHVRLVVAPGYRGRGIGRTLAERGVHLAESLGMSKLTIEITASNTGARTMFVALGFAEEAHLRGQVRDQDGRSHDLVLLSRWVDGGTSPPSTTSPGMPDTAS